VLRRERGERGKEAGRERDGRPGKKKQDEHQDKGEQRGRTSGILQGRIRKIRELQGPICKTKFPVELKP
jgi:hypothetical protein